jgi:hypothetical protein
MVYLNILSISTFVGSNFSPAKKASHASLYSYRYKRLDLINIPQSDIKIVLGI